MRPLIPESISIYRVYRCSCFFAQAMIADTHPLRCLILGRCMGYTIQKRIQCFLQAGEPQSVFSSCGARTTLFSKTVQVIIVYIQYSQAKSHVLRSHLESVCYSFILYKDKGFARTEHQIRVKVPVKQKKEEDPKPGKHGLPLCHTWVGSE